MDELINWDNTKDALEQFMSLLTCTACDGLLKDACSFRTCEHYFCKLCAMDLVNNTKPCPECGIVLWKEHMQNSLKIPEVVAICLKIKRLIYREYTERQPDDPSKNCSKDEEVVVLSDDDYKDETNERKVEEDDQNLKKSCKHEQGKSAVVKVIKECSDITEPLDNEHDSINNGDNSNLEKPLLFSNQKNRANVELFVDTSVPACNERNKSIRATLQNPTISSQFSSAITKSESGAQENPWKLLKKPKITYGKRQATLKEMNKTSRHSPKKAKPNDEKNAVFEFTSSAESNASNAEDKKECTLRTIDEIDDQKNSHARKPSSLIVHRNKKKRRNITMNETRNSRTRSNPNIKNGSNVPESETGAKESENKTGAKKTGNTKGSKVSGTTIEWRNTTDEQSSKINKNRRQTEAKKAKKTKLERRNKNGETALHTACIKGKFELAKELLEQGSEPNTKDFAGWTPLHEASNQGFTNIVELLLSYGAIIDTVAGDDLDTPLHDAVANDHLDVVKLLISHNAPLHLKNRSGLLPSDCSVSDGMKKYFEQVEKPQETIQNDSRFDEIEIGIEKIFITTNITQAQKTHIQKCCKLLDGRLVQEMEDRVTHVICGVDAQNISISRTLKYWHGVLCGKWMVSYQWVLDSERQQKWLREADYELKGTLDASHGVPRKARINRMKMLPQLFEGCSFFLSGEFDDSLTKEMVGKLITIGGGKLLSREPKTSDADPLLTPASPALSRLKLLPACASPMVVFHARDTSAQTCCTQYIIYDEKKSPAYTRIFSPVLSSSTVAWLLDCFSNFEILDIKDKHNDTFQYSQS